MPDVVDVKRWHFAISEWREFADKQGAEFELKRFENGKEMMLLRLYYHKPKGDQNGKSVINK